MIATLSSVLPTIALEEGVSMVPAEAALMTIEIKTTLTTDGLAQLSAHNQWIGSTKIALRSQHPNIIPTAILALDSDLSAQRVTDWMQERKDGQLVNGNTVMCCTIGRFHLLRQGDKVIQIDSDDDHIETMHFISDYWGALAYLAHQRRGAAPFVFALSPYPHPLEAYLKGLRPE